MNWKEQQMAKWMYSSNLLFIRDDNEEEKPLVS